MENSEEIKLQGLAVSDGIAIGPLFFLNDPALDNLPKEKIATSEVEKEIARYRKALTSSRCDLKELQQCLKEEGSEEAVGIIESHIQMLDDPILTTLVEDKIREMLQNTEAAYISVVEEYEEKFTGDSFFKQRLLDVKDISRRIMRHLIPEKNASNEKVPIDAILLAKELVPSDAAEARADRVGGFISHMGSATSHAALISRAKGIPYIANIEVDHFKDHVGKMAILDGVSGTLILNPSNETLAHYKNLELSQLKERITTQKELLKPCETTDGISIEVMANIESLNELKLLHDLGSTGIGLFRSEFLFLSRDLFAITEEDESLLYREILREARGLPLNFRLLDTGGDKGNTSRKEPNPALGNRAIRFLLSHEEIFRRQVRAILQVAHEGDLRLLLPLISDLDELLSAKVFIQKICDELQVKCPPIGCMIEVPSAVITCETIAQNCDFLSIGTNDLVQYTLACDRLNPEVSDRFRPAHPSILKMIHQVTTTGEKVGIPVSLCGEVASRPLYTKLLLGLGLKKFSCSPRFIPKIKAVIRQTSLKEAEAFAQEILAISSAQVVFDRLDSQ